MKETKEYYIFEEGSYNSEIIYNNYKSSFFNLLPFIFFLLGIILYTLQYNLFNNSNHYYIENLGENIPSINPVRSSKTHISSSYRPHNRPNHNGIDIVDKIGTSIIATADGVVTYSKYDGYRKRGYGNMIKIKHFDGYETWYAHLNRRYVKKGEKVYRGNVIGELGNTGNSTGPHLHYEVRYNNKPQNPKRYLN